ncbi:signal transducing kinase of the PAK [Tulasnella sp. UAMH 9824]|nr:signal transducing kinase of the PAK [Tulasnella sp. UAMH 9824]
MSGSAPYSKITNQALIMMEMYKKSVPGSIDALNTVILGSDVDLACRTGVSSLQSIIPQCWNFDPAQRPPASRILQQIAASTQNDASSHQFATPNFAKPDLFTSTSTPNTRSTPPTLTSSSAGPVGQQGPPFPPKPSSYPQQSTETSSPYSSKQSYPPPRPPRNHAANLSDILPSGQTSGRRLSSPQAAADQLILPSLDPGDSPPPSPTRSRSRSSTSGKNKKGMLSLMSDFLSTSKRPEISTPYDPVHLTHIGFNSSTGRYTGVPRMWHQFFRERGLPF